MDIRQWLQNTADREPPDEQDSHARAFPQFLHSQHRSEQPLASAPHRKRKHEPTASIDEQPTRKRRRQAASSSPRPAQLRRAEVASTSSRSSQGTCSRETELSDPRRSQEPRESYERRPRHKTRVDLYEAKRKRHRRAGSEEKAGTRKSKSKSKSKSKHKSKPKKRESRKAADGVRTSGLVQNFQLKNGPKGSNRLTLHPDLSAGIFKHGRSSTRVAGPGLPDLVFNEMKFLQKPKEHQDELPAEDPQKQPAKKSRKQLQEEEVSTYFAARPSHADAVPLEPANRLEACREPKERDGIRIRQSQNDGTRRAHRSGQRRRSPAEEALPGPTNSRSAHEAMDGRAQSTTYYTWSESAPVGVKSIGDDSHTRHDRAKTRTRSRSNREERPSKPHLRHDTRVAKAAEDVPTQRTRNTAHRQASKIASSRSAYRPRPLFDNSASTGQSNRQEVGVFHTSDILNVRDSIPDGQWSSSLPGHNFAPHSRINKENAAPSASTPTSKLVRHAFDAVAGQQLRVGGLKNHIVEEPHEEQLEDEQYQNQEFDAHDMATARLQDEWIHPYGSPVNQLPRRGLPHSTELRYPEHHEVTGTTPALLVKPEQPRQVRPLTAVTSRQDVKLAKYSDIPIQRHGTGHIYAGGTQAEDLVRRLATDQGMANVFASRPEPPESVSIGVYSSRPGQMDDMDAPYVDEAALTRISTERLSAPSHQDELPYNRLRKTYEGKEVRNELKDFWKPNMLY